MSASERAQAVASPPRMLLIGRPLGLHAENFFPEKPGHDFESTRYLKLLDPMREHFTVFSGMSHNYATGHFAAVGLMTGVSAELIRSEKDIKNSISLDQEVAEHIGNQTRFSSLVMGGGNLSWNRRGVRLPSDQHPGQVFRRLFITGTPQEVERELHRIRDGESILDEVRGQIDSLDSKASTGDRERLDLFLTSLREAEQHLQQDEHWNATPKPKVNVKPPAENLKPSDLVAQSRQWLDLAHLALQTDSTRSISLNLSISVNVHPEIDGVTLGHHDASHHGQDPTKLAQLALIEEAEVKVFCEFLEKMKATNDGEQTLLERTAVLYASNLGNASSHDNHNLPIVLAGGSFKHQGHLAFDRQNNMLLSNLFVRMLHHMDIPAAKFGASTGVISAV